MNQSSLAPLESYMRLRILYRCATINSYHKYFNSRNDLQYYNTLRTQIPSKINEAVSYFVSIYNRSRTLELQLTILQAISNMNLVTLSQILLGFILPILGSPLSSPSSSVALDVRNDKGCPSPDLNLCTLEVLVYMKLNMATVNIYDANCVVCPKNYVFRPSEGPKQWKPSCIKEKPMNITVDANGELHPILWGGVQYNIGIVPSSNKDPVTHRQNFGCSTTSAAPTPTSSTSPTPTSGKGCDISTEPPDGTSCHDEWLNNHYPAAGSGTTGD